MHADEFDPISHFQRDDHQHCFLIFEKVNVDLFPLFTTWLSSPLALEILLLHRMAIGISPLLTNQLVVIRSPLTSPVDLFIQGEAVQTFVPNQIQGEVGNEPDLEQLIPNLKDLELITTHNAMWILPNQNPNPNPNTWVCVYSAILQNGHLGSCLPLVRFMQVQLFGNSEANTHPFQGLVQRTLATASLIRHCNSVLIHMTPTETLGAPPAPAPMQGMSATDFQGLVAALHLGHTHQAPAAPGTAGTTVKKRWSVNIQTLLKLTHCTSVVELAPVWSAIAKGTKKEEHNILQDALNDLARNPGASTSASLTVTKDLHNTVVNLMFWSGDPDRLDEGLHPFCTV